MAQRPYLRLRYTTKQIVRIPLMPLFKGFVKVKGTLYAAAHSTPNTLFVSPINGPVYIPANQLVAE